MRCGMRRLSPKTKTGFQTAAAGRFLAAVARAHTNSRIVSCAAPENQIAVNWSARCSFPSIIASRRSVLTRSPDFIGISEGAIAMQLRRNRSAKL